MQVDDPPYLSVGTAVSAKYKGAFCEAKVSKVDRVVKCKVTFRSGLGAATVSDNEIKGNLRVGQQVQVKHPDHKDLIEASITKIQDCSQYTVVFDDGDITTLRRTALCLKSGRHFNESETLDQLPLTHPEHFGIPVMGGRRGRRNRLLKEESSDEEMEEENEPDLEGYTQDIGRVVSVETGENKRGREKWFPGLIVIPSAQPTVKINVKDEFLIRSFRDDRYYTVPKKEVSEFSKDLLEKIDSPGLLEAIQKANKFLDSNELPLHWEKSALFNVTTISDSEENATDSSDEEQSEEKDRFVAQLYKYMDDSGTPLNKTPTICNKDIDLHRLFLIVDKLGGYNRVTNQNKWKSVAGKMRLNVNLSVSNQVKSVYKRCLLSYEGFFRTLGVTMSNPTRPTKKDKGRSLIRDKDRTTPISSPRPERDDEIGEKVVERKGTPSLPEKIEAKPKRKSDAKEKDSLIVVKKIKQEPRDASGSDVSDTASTSGTSRPKRHEIKSLKDKKVKPAQGEKVKVMVEKMEEKIQFTRSKSLSSVKPKEGNVKDNMVTTRQSKDGGGTSPTKSISKPVKKVPVKEEEIAQVEKEKDKKPKLKKKSETEKPSAEPSVEPHQTANIGDKLIVYYGPTNESKVTYEAKVVDMDKDQTGPIYFVHYTGWNTRYDEWIPACRIAENLNSGVKSKRSKVPAPVNVKPSTSSSGQSTSGTSKPVAIGKRSRLASVSSRGATEEKPPRSTTPSSVTSTSSVSKSPAAPAMRSIRLAAKRESKRRSVSSAQTDLSVQSDSESDSSESEAELPRTRSGSIKTEEPELRVYRRKIAKPAPPIKTQKRKEPPKEDDDDDDTEKEEEPEKISKEQRKVKKLKKSPEKSPQESDDEEDDDEDEDSVGGHPKGRDFDLNQIRSELKGFAKTLKVPAIELDKDNISVSSSDDATDKVPPIAIKEENEEAVVVKVEEEAKPKPLSPKMEKSSSCEDIYEFKEPEPFEFESRTKLGDDKGAKKRLPRIFDALEDKSPRRRAGARSPLSPGKTDKLGLPEPRTYSRIPKKPPISEDEDDDDEDLTEEDLSSTVLKNEDPFDKLIESPSFNLIKTSPEKVIENKPAHFGENAVSIFKEAPETSDECSRDMELSDCDSQTQIFTREDTLFSAGASSSNAFPKSPPVVAVAPVHSAAVDDRSATPDFSGNKTDEGKTTNSDDDDIQAQIQRAIDQSTSSSDEDSSDTSVVNLLSNAPTKIPPEESTPGKVLGISPIKKESPPHPSIDKEAVVSLVPISKNICLPLQSKEPTTSEPAVSIVESPPVAETKQPSSPKKPTIDPALQETDSSLLELIVSKPPLILDPKLDDTGKELTVKTGTKIADSILQKFNFIKNNIETKSGGVKAEMVEAKPVPGTSKQENVVPVDENSKGSKAVSEEAKIEEAVKPSTSKVEKETEVPRRRRRAVSKPIVEESESDSSDSENLVIGSEGEEDSQTNSSENKPLIECKNTDSNISLQKTVFTTDDSQSQPPEEEKRNFSFDEILKRDEAEKIDEVPEVEKSPSRSVKEDGAKSEEPADAKDEPKEEQDPNLHSLLLCEEELPRSPAPISELPGSSREGGSTSSVHEMPFASAPGTSNSKMLLDPKKHQPPPLLMPIERESSRVDAQTVIENTPPTTPESTISNLSPRGDNGNASPNSNDSKSNEGDYAEHRVGVKVSPYSEEDTQTGGDLSSSRKSSESFGPPLGYRKRRRSLRNSEDGPSGGPVPAKRGRKPRQRRDSDSDDASESSMAGSANGGKSPGSTTSMYERSTRSPRPSKYNFFVEFDPSLDSTQRIAVLQQKLSELRKTYADVKAELATVERRRKKLRRREREALKTAKQEMACA